jgi:S-adenosylmethionine:tRNA ribosyltransferase-isomerase
LATPQIAMTYQLSDFDFELPEELIAQTPTQVRSQSRLLDVRGEDEFSDRTFTDLVELLNPEDLLVFNNSKVIAARLFAQKPSGGRVEILVERIGPAPNQASVLLRVSRKPAAGMRLQLESHEEVLCLGRDPAHDDRFLLQFNRPVLDVLDDFGQLPLPPYIGHTPTKNDLQRYQTIYAQHPGSVAAPTAGLHFDETLFAALQAKGIQRAEVTLHVGSGTFAPVRANDLSKHRMHYESCSLSEVTEQKILKTKAQGGRVVAVGTTSLRTLESAGQRAMGAEGLIISNPGAANVESLTGLTGLAGQWETDLFITPGYQFKVVDVLVTNFHLPKSTLLMLVSAFAGYPTIRRAYDHAIASRYRFFSYGDAMFLSSLRRSNPTSPHEPLPLPLPSFP